MRFTDQQIGRLADKLLGALQEKDLVELKAERGRVAARLGEIIRANLGEEQSLDAEAKQLLEQHLKNAPPGVDRHKLFLMIKKKLAEDKGVPL